MSTKLALESILASHPEVSSIFVTDREGVVLLRAGKEGRGSERIAYAHSSSLNVTAEPGLCDLLGLGTHKTTVLYYNNSQIVIVSERPVSVFIVAQKTAVTTSLLRIVDEIKPLMPTIAIVVGLIDAHETGLIKLSTSENPQCLPTIPQESPPSSSSPDESIHSNDQIVPCSLSDPNFKTAASGSAQSDCPKCTELLARAKKDFPNIEDSYEDCICFRTK